MSFFFAGWVCKGKASGIRLQYNNTRNQERNQAEGKCIGKIRSTEAENQKVQQEK